MDWQRIVRRLSIMLLFGVSLMQLLRCRGGRRTAERIHPVDVDAPQTEAVPEGRFLQKDQVHQGGAKFD